MKRNTIFLVLSVLLLLAVSLVGCDNLPFGAQPTPTVAPITSSQGQVIVEGRVVPADDAALFFGASGKVTSVLVSEGDEVSEGQVLARLGDRESIDAQVAAAQLALVQAQQNHDDLLEKADLAYADAALVATQALETLLTAQEAYEDYDTDDYQDKIDDAQLKKEDAEDDLDDAKDEFAKYENLDRDNPDRERTQDDLDDAQLKYDEAMREYKRLVNDRDAAKAELDLAQTKLDDAVRVRDERVDGPDPDDLALTQANLENAKAQLTAAEASLARLDLKAPFAGTIVKIDISVGQDIQSDQVVMVIADFSQWYVETKDLTENEVVDVELEQSAIVIPDALPDLQLLGRVKSIGLWYGERSGDVTYETRILLVESDPKLRWGMTVEVSFSK